MKKNTQDLYGWLIIFILICGVVLGFVWGAEVQKYWPHLIAWLWTSPFGG